MTSIKERLSSLKASIASGARAFFTVEYIIKTILLFLFFMCFSVDLSMVSSLMFASPAMLKDPFTLGKGFDKETIGRLSSISTATFFAGKLLMPFVIDKLGGPTTNLLVTLGISIGTFMFGFAAYGFYFTNVPEYNGGIIVQAVLITIWSINKFLDAASWSGLTVIVRTWFPKTVWGSMYVVLN